MAESCESMRQFVRVCLFTKLKTENVRGIRPLPPSGRVSPAREWVRVQSDTHPQGATSLSRL